MERSLLLTVCSFPSENSYNIMRLSLGIWRCARVGYGFLKAYVSVAPSRNLDLWESPGVFGMPDRSRMSERDAAVKP